MTSGVGRSGHKGKHRIAIDEDAPDYLGQQAWRRWVEVLRDTSRQLRTFKPE
ncbi:MAG: hypothetical protein IPK15_19340 [Verrucomicrobia bacterium]|nr:hypothetical protein [Verrucomicrobiota bacterium]